MRPNEIDQLLLETLDDRRLSRGERRVLGEAFAEAGADDPQRAALLRSRAFAIARARTRDGRDGQLLDWLEEVIKTLAAARAADEGPLLAEAHFSPGERCRRRIVSLIRSCRRQAAICVFTITDDAIAEALLEAHQRGVDLRLITDDDKAGDRGSDVAALARAGVPVRVDHSEHHMHHKFALFDGAILVTGSYNWTRSAAADNEENIVVSSEPRLVAPFAETFEALWRRFDPSR